MYQTGKVKTSKRHVTLRLTVPQAKALAHMAGQMRDHYSCQLHETGDFDHAGVSKADAARGLTAMAKLDEAITKAKGWE